MGHAPPDILRFNAQFAVKLRNGVIVDAWGKQAQIARNEKEEHMAVIHGHDAVVDAVVHAVRLSRSISHQPLRRRGRDVNFHGGGTERSGRKSEIE